MLQVSSQSVDLEVSFEEEVTMGTTEATPCAAPHSQVQTYAEMQSEHKRTLCHLVYLQQRMIAHLESQLKYQGANSETEEHSTKEANA